MIPDITKIFVYQKAKKKGSLSLSINAIVILVLAIAMLGLGLAFTKTMFKKFGEKLSVPPPDIPATTEEPIVLPTDELLVKHGDEFVFAVNYYNDGNDGFIKPHLMCYGILSSTIGTEMGELDGVTLMNNEDFLTIAAKQIVEGGTYKGFKFIIPGEPTNTGFTGVQDVCEVQFCHVEGDFESDCEEKQVVFKVT